MGEGTNCWACKMPIDNEGQRCDRCGSGIICPSCGKCTCDYVTDEESVAKKESPRTTFQRLVDEAEEVKITEEADPEPIERELLAAVIQESGCAGAAAPDLVLDGLEPDQFRTAAIRDLAKIIFPYARKRGVINSTVIRGLLPEGRLRDLALELTGDVYDAAAFSTYVEVVRKNSHIAKALEVMAPAAQQLLAGADGVPSLAVALSRAQEGLITVSGGELLGDSEYHQLPSFCIALERRQQEREFVGYDTGFTHLNRVINGLCPGVLMMLAGPPGGGKTTLGKQLHYSVGKLSGALAIFIAFEQSADELRIKTLAQISGVDHRSIMRGKHSTDTEAWHKVQTATAEIMRSAEKSYIVEADASVTIDRIQVIAEAAMAHHGTNQCVLIIDYLQIIPSSDLMSKMSVYDKVSFHCSELKRLARKLKISIVAISSESRNNYNKKTLGVFKESGEIEYGADVAAVLHIDKTRTGELVESGKDARAVDLLIVKNRNGENAQIGFNFYPKLCQFAEYDYKHVEYHEGLENDG